jgi:YidC/Oxa1 family membrane protein insertase
VNPLNPLYDAVAWVIMRIHSVVGAVVNPNSGLAWVLTIVFLTVLMRLILVPLFVKQMHATRKMTALAPQMQELRKKYKSDRQTLNEETMKLYRENGVNPLGGCLPLVAQLPLFFALFGVLRAISGWHPGLPLPYGLTEPVIQSALHANILGATIADKVLFVHTPEPLQAKIVICLAVVVSVVTTFLTVRQSTKRGMTPQMTPDNPMASSQKYMMYIVPLFALSGLYWAFGLVLYWMTTNLWTLGQQYVLFRRFPSLTGPAAAGAAGASAGTDAASSPAKLVGGGTKQRPGPKRVAGGPKQVTAGNKPAASGAKRVTADPKQTGNGAKRPTPAAQGKRPTNSQGKQQPAAAQSKQSAAQARGNAQAQGKQPAASAQSSPATGAAPAKPGQASKQGQAKRPAGGQAKPDGSRPASAGGQQAGSNGSGLLRRFGRGRSEPEQQPETHEVKLVRQQRVRQPRSKRSGKR